jgi:hypothetical protein
LYRLTLVKTLTKPDYRTQLKSAIERLHDCSAHHQRTVTVEEVANGKTIWQGEVEVFGLVGHPQARRCYGWRVGDSQDFITVLELPPVDSPQTAVSAHLARLAKPPSERPRK